MAGSYIHVAPSVYLLLYNSYNPYPPTPIIGKRVRGPDLRMTSLCQCSKKILWFREGIMIDFQLRIYGDFIIPTYVYRLL